MRAREVAREVSRAMPWVWLEALAWGAAWQERVQFPAPQHCFLGSGEDLDYPLSAGP